MTVGHFVYVHAHFGDYVHFFQSDMKKFLQVILLGHVYISSIGEKISSIKFDTI